MAPIRLALYLVPIAILAAGQKASAQSTEPKWDVQGYAGIAVTNDQVNGSGSLPTTGTILQGMMSASTLYFGDGARLFNQNQSVVLGGQTGSTIVPLDPILVSSAIRRERGASFGLRLERRLNRRLAIEMAGDCSVDHLAFTPVALTGLEATRGSFTTALEHALAISPVTAAVTSIATVNDHQTAVQLFTTGTLVVTLKDTGRMIPYVAGGGGVVFNGGNTPSATLVGNYQLGSPAQLLGTDTVALRYAENARAEVISAGAGFQYLMTPKWGIRIDGRTHFYKNSTANLVDVTPKLAAESTGQPFPLVNSGSLQFFTTAPLNGAPVVGATTFNGSGVQAHLVLSVGFFRRF